MATKVLIHSMESCTQSLFSKRPRAIRAFGASSSNSLRVVRPPGLHGSAMRVHAMPQRPEQEQRNAGTPCNPRPSPGLPCPVTGLMAALASLATAAATSPAAQAMGAMSDSSAPHYTSILDWMLVGLLVYWTVRVMSYGAGQGSAGQQGPGADTTSSSAAKRSSQKQRDEREKEEDDKSLTGVTHAHVRSYVDMTESSANPNSPDIIELRNRTLSRAAVYSVAAAVKEARPRIKQLLRELSTFKPVPVPAPATPAAGSSSSTSAPGPSPVVLTKPHCTESDPVADMVWSELTAQAAAGRRWDDMSFLEHERLEMQLAEEVAERAALEQIRAVVRVASHAYSGEQAGPGSSDSSAGNSSRGPGGGRQSRGRDIRGGGAH